MVSEILANRGKQEQMSGMNVVNKETVIVGSFILSHSIPKKKILVLILDLGKLAGHK